MILAWFITGTGQVTGQILTGPGGCGFHLDFIMGDGSDLVLNLGVGGGGSQKMDQCSAVQMDQALAWSIHVQNKTIAATYTHYHAQEVRGRSVFVGFLCMVEVYL